MTKWCWRCAIPLSPRRTLAAGKHQRRRPGWYASPSMIFAQETLQKQNLKRGGIGASRIWYGVSPAKCRSPRYLRTCSSCTIQCSQHILRWAVRNPSNHSTAWITHISQYRQFGFWKSIAPSTTARFLGSGSVQTICRAWRWVDVQLEPKASQVGLRKLFLTTWNVCKAQKHAKFSIFGTHIHACHTSHILLSIPISLAFPLNGLESRSWFMVSWPHFLRWEALLVKAGVKHEEGLVQQWPWGCRVVPACKPWTSSHLNLTNT